MINKQEVVDKYLIDNFKNIEDWRSGKVLCYPVYKETQDKKDGVFSWNKILGGIEQEAKVDKGTLFVYYEDTEQYDKMERERTRKKFLRLRDKQEPTAFCNSEYRLEDKVHNLTAKVEKFRYLSGKEDKSKGAKEFTFTADNIPTEEEIIGHFNIDTKKWKIVNIYHKTSFGGKYSITVQTNLLKGEESANYIKAFSDFIENYNVSLFKQPNRKEVKDLLSQKNMFLINLADLHVCNFQNEGYLERMEDKLKLVINSLSVSNEVTDVIIANLGDLLHSNTSKGETFQNTRLEMGESLEEGFTKALTLLTNLLNHCAEKGLRTTYISVRGNHSYDSEWMLSEGIKKIYEKDKLITVINNKESRTYHNWNNNSFMFVHGDKGLDRLPLTFATEGRDWFSKADHKLIVMGHVHHSNNKKFLTDTGEFNGIEVRVCSSPSSSDRWHKNESFVQAKKQITCMLFSEDDGKYAEYNLKF